MKKFFPWFVLVIGLLFYATSILANQPTQPSCEERLAYTTKYATNLDQERGQKGETIAVLQVINEKLTQQVQDLQGKNKELEVRLEQK